MPLRPLGGVSDGGAKLAKFPMFPMLTVLPVLPPPPPTLSEGARYMESAHPTRIVPPVNTTAS